MPLPKFDYIAPKTLKEASELLEKYGDKAKLKAGGTDLLIRMNNRVLTPEVVIGLKQLEELNYIEYDEKNGLKIGALATLSDVANNKTIRAKYPAISYAASVTATNQVRNMGTVIGNLCNAAPSADNAPGLLALEGKAVLFSKAGERTVELEDFFKGPGMTCLEKNEILKEVIVPVHPKNSAAVYNKISPRSKVDIAIVNVGVFVEVDNKKFTKVNIFLGAVAPIPMRAEKAEDFLTGKEISEENIYQAGKIASDEASPISDVRSSKEYRKMMVEILTRRSIADAVNIVSC